MNADGAIAGVGGELLGYNLYAYCFNNPVNLKDPTGNWPKWSTVFKTVAVVAGAIAVAAACVAMAPAVLGGAVAASTAAYVAGVAACTSGAAVIAAGVSAARESSSSSSRRRQSGNHTVYQLVDESGKVEYVGRTKNLVAREKAHKANPARSHLKLDVIKDNLNYFEARGIEQTYMLYHHTLNTNNEMNNQINGISPNNENKWNYIKAARGALGYVWNQVSNEVLYWAGQ